jgi:hypothetical protein
MLSDKNISKSYFLPLKTLKQQVKDLGLTYWEVIFHYKMCILIVLKVHALKVPAKQVDVTIL